MRILRAATAHVRRQPVAYLALLVAMSGTAVAATPLVTSAGVANNSLTSLDVRNESLVSADVKNRSLLAVDFKLGQLPKGAKGDAGTPGTKGDKGDKGDTGTVAIGAWHTVGAAGEPAFGTGFQAEAGQRVRFRLEGDVVRLAGMFDTAVAPWDNTTAPVFTLPVGMRPTTPARFITIGEQTSVHGYVFVNLAGEVYARGATNVFGHLEGITFSTT